MVNIDTRPDLIRLLIELNQYNCQFVKDNQIVIELPQFKKKKNEEWYGITLVCKPNRKNALDVYVCKDLDNTTHAYIGKFEDVTTLDDLIYRSIEAIKVCSNCHTEHDLDDMYIRNNKLICNICNNKVRSKY